MSEIGAANTLSLELEVVRSGRGRDLATLCDAEVVSAAIRGDPEAFGELVDRHRPAAMKVAISIVGYDRAEDVVQESLLLAFRALPTIRDRCRFAQWLTTITRFRALRVGRMESRHTRGRVVIDEVFLESHPSPRGGDRLASLELSEILRALELLPRHYAEVVRLHFLQNFPHETISRRLGVPLSTVKWRCFRGKSLLRDQLAAGRPGPLPVRDESRPCVQEGLRVTCSRPSQGRTKGAGAEPREGGTLPVRVRACSNGGR